MPRRVLFAIRSKLGDTLISYQCARAFADAFPQTSVTLLTRSDYAGLLARETGIRIIGFNSRIGMILKLLWLRVTAAPFDVLGVLWGSGPPIRLIGRLVNARRRIAWSRRFAPDLFEEGRLPGDHALIDPAASVIAAFEPAFQPPRSLSIPSLAERYARCEGKVAVGVVPIADETRRNFDPATLGLLIAEIRRRHPDRPIRIFVNPGNAGADALMRAPLPPGCEIRSFRDLGALVEEYMELCAWIGTDTGLYHLAAAIGIPSTVFFGPTQPHKIVLPGQTNATVHRLAILGNTHCEEKTCTRPLCLHANVAVWGHAQCATRIDETPGACPLRAYPPHALTQIADLSPA